MTCLQCIQSRLTVQATGRMGTRLSELSLEVLHPQNTQDIRYKLAGIGDMPPFNHYPYLYWSMHCRASSKSDDLENLLESIQALFVTERRLVLLHLDIVAGAELVAADGLGNTMVHRAVINFDREALNLLLRVDLLLEQSTTVDIRNGTGHTALHLAVMKGDDTMFRALIAAGSNPDAEDVFGLTPLQMAIVLDQERIIELMGQLRLPTPDANGTSLSKYAEYFRNDQAVRALLISGVSLGQIHHMPNSLVRQQDDTAFLRRTES
ncbi:ankyrin [Byssothecium circinans]|uniref:protein S-acyltransferase n=1 Tax=Byssothecium circinans TaxID=147558 RepID=A0A6A5TXX4_9PLEO|nr:ankyrin [Byssothecium circinans]